QIWANDTDGDILTVYWYENTTGSYILRNTNTSVSANSTVNFSFTQFNNYFITYWWKVAVNDSTDNTTEWYYFITEPLDTSVDLITTYNVTTSPFTISATNNTPVDNVSLWYKYSSDNIISSWGTIGEVRNLTNIDNSWTTLNFWNIYTNPVVVSTYNLASGSDNEAVVRISNVTSTSCDIKIQNPGDDHLVTAGDVYIIVIDEGAYNLSDGTKVEAYKYNESTTAENGNWAVGTSQTYSNSYTNPVVLGQVMSQNDTDWSVFWCSNGVATDPADSSNLYTSKHVGEDTDITRNEETLGYIVIEQSSGTINGINYRSELGSDTIEGVLTGGAPYTYSLSGTYSMGVATLNAMDGSDGGFVILYGASPIDTNIGLAIDEDTIGDLDRSHTTEQVAYWVFDSVGNITSDSVPAWQFWNNGSNPDENSPWSWDFDFPNGPGYYKFCSIGNKSGSPNETAPDIADTGCRYNTPPTIDIIYPTNGSTDIGVLPMCSIWANDSIGDTLTVYWYENSTGGYVLRNTNNSVSANSIVNFTFTQFDNYSRTYYWKVVANDTIENTTAWFYFTTEAINTSVDTIDPYNTTSSQITINATGDSILDNVTLWYRFSTDNSSWDDWTVNITDTGSPWQWSFNFTNANGTGYYEFYSIGNKSGSTNETAPPAADARCHYPNTSIQIIPEQWDIGTTTIGSYNYSTSDFYFNLTNEGNVALNIQIKADNATNSTTSAQWNLTTTPGFNNFSLQYN
ncbi:hypothetical protein MBGDF03_01071, partial [Thermoplasmatales archaeon SCGC AB-540-F20]